MYDNMTPLAEINVTDISELSNDILCSDTPLVLRGLVEHWPVVDHAKNSVNDVQGYICSFYNKQPVHLMRGKAKDKGRLFYNDEIDGFNFSKSRHDLLHILSEIENTKNDDDADTLYVGSTSINHVMPGFRAENDIPQLADSPLVSIWLGNRSRVAAHYDVTDNLACVVAGKRRFTLFPSEQLENLYIGPLDYTPAGQPASLVDFSDPDFERFPKFAVAQQHGMTAELEPGDAIFIPSMWWHHVEALEQFNVLINYWWRQVPHHMGVPFDALTHAILAIRELPKAQRDAWRNIFDHYVFDPQSSDHIPQDQRGMLNPIDENMARRLRATLLNHLNR